MQYVVFFFPEIVYSFAARGALQDAGVLANASKMPEALAKLAGIPEGYCKRAILIRKEDVKKAACAIQESSRLGTRAKEGCKIFHIDSADATLDPSIKRYLDVWKSMEWSQK